MVIIEKFYDNSKVIARDNDYFLVTNDLSGSFDNPLTLVSLINKDGIYLTGSYPLDLFLRDDDAVWERIDGKYGDYIKRLPQNICVDSLLGFSVGDALGVPVEFLSRDVVRRLNIKDMVGCDTGFNIDSRWGHTIPAGSWSDDTSMLIASMSSIIDCKGTVNYNDIMKKFLAWWYKGEYTSCDITFGLGSTVCKALKKYLIGVSPLNCGGTNIRDNGNGSLMRILPFSMYCIKTGMDEENTFRFIGNASSLTHGHGISKMSCFIYTEFLRIICLTKNPDLAFSHIGSIDYSKYFSKDVIEAHAQILNPRFLNVRDVDISEKNGYVVSTLASVLYSILTTDNYEDAVLKSINMGYDTDTVGGITGGIAGILYGRESIPESWLYKLKKKDYLIDLAEKYDSLLFDLKKKVK